VSGDHVLLAPPYIIDETHLDEMIQKLSEALAAVLPALETATTV
jgi:adenosylmethionine-8-amino-7-oxononanoate aminotransferase